MTDPKIIHALEAFARKAGSPHQCALDSPDEAALASPVEGALPSLVDGALPSPVEGALIVSQIINPATDVAWCRDQLAEIASAMPSNVDATAFVENIRQLGFKGASDYHKSENSALDHVLHAREGIPISLAMMILGVCEHIDMSAHGVNFPGHFLVALNDDLLDPFTLTVVNEMDCRRWLRQHDLEPKGAFTTASATDTVLRMLNNLSMLANANDDAARALELADYKLAVSEAPLPIYLERVELWLRLDVASMARRDLSSAIALTSDPAAVAVMQARLAEIPDSTGKLH